MKNCHKSNHLIDESNSFSTPDLLSLLRQDDHAAWKFAYPLLRKAVVAVGRAEIENADLENIASDVICDEIIPGLSGQKGESFDKLTSFAGLLGMARKIMLRRCIDEFRRQRSRKMDSYAEVPDQECLPQVLADGGRTWAEWMTLVQQELDPPDLFYDRFGLGLTTRQIAERRGMPHGTVVSRFARALKRLRGILEDKDNEEDEGLDPTP